MSIVAKVGETWVDRRDGRRRSIVEIIDDEYAVVQTTVVAGRAASLTRVDIIDGRLAGHDRQEDCPPEHTGKAPVSPLVTARDCHMMMEALAEWTPWNESDAHVRDQLIQHLRETADESMRLWRARGVPTYVEFHRGEAA